jgi:hypothetical protein
MYNETGKKDDEDYPGIWLAGLMKKNHVNSQFKDPVLHLRFRLGTIWIQVKTCYHYTNTAGHKSLRSIIFN